MQDFKILSAFQLMYEAKQAFSVSFQWRIAIVRAIRVVFFSLWFCYNTAPLILHLIKLYSAFTTVILNHATAVRHRAIWYELAQVDIGKCECEIHWKWLSAKLMILMNTKFFVIQFNVHGYPFHTDTCGTYGDVSLLYYTSNHDNPSKKALLLMKIRWFIFSVGF